MFTLKDRVNMHTSFTTHCSDDFGENEDYDGGLAVAEQKPQLKKPSLYQVLLMNDDYTPMEFVVEVLETYFMKTREQATQIMLKVHTEGSAVCGVFPRDIAETKSAQVDEFSKVNQHPLKSIVQAAD